MDVSSEMHSAYESLEATTVDFRFNVKPSFASTSDRGGTTITVVGMPTHANLPAVVDATRSLAVSLENPTVLVTLHRDIDDLRGKDGKRLGRSPKQYALRWGIFSMTYAATEAFFNEILGERATRTRHLPLSPDKIRGEGQRQGINLFTNVWGVRTRVPGRSAGNRSRWMPYVGTQALRDYLGDMKSLRDHLSHGGDRSSTPNESGALWPLSSGRHSMRLMGAEGFIQASADLATQTVLAYGGELSQVPNWPESERSVLSAEKRPPLPLIL